MKHLQYFINGALVLFWVFFLAMCEAQKDQTLTISPGKAHDIRAYNREGKMLYSAIKITDSTGTVVYALKQNGKWKIVEAGKALDVLIADLEVCKQNATKTNISNP